MEHADFDFTVNDCGDQTSVVWTTGNPTIKPL
jgi:hypothetical protein